MKAFPPFLILIASLTGCATQYEVRTNAYLGQTPGRAQISPNASFAVLPNANVPNAIFDEEVKTKIENLLLSKGYRLEKKGDSDYWIRYSYSMEGKQETVVEPHWVSRPMVTHRVYVQGSNSYTTVVVPDYDYVTYLPTTHTYYVAKLFVRVMDARSPNEEKSIWVGDSFTESSNPDLREVMDYLLIGTFRFFNQDTGKQREVGVTASDKEVQALKTVPPAVLEAKN